jgi:hypothetical protein
MSADHSQKKKHIQYAHEGQSLVELAVSLVLLLILLAGIFDLGRAIIAYFILQDAAEEGIVFGTSFPTDCNQINMRIRDDIDTGFVPSTVSINIKIQNAGGTYTPCYTIPYAQVYAGRILQIQLSTNFPITMPIIGTIIGGQTVPLVVNTNGIILRPPPPT